jgi:hypothetical protein
MRFRLGAVLVAWAALAMLSRAVSAQDSACGLHAPDAASRAKESCLSCHGGESDSHGHPVDLDYASARARRPADLRSADEVSRRGVRIPGGQLRCATCHDGASPWAHYVALPPGAAPLAPFDPSAPVREDGTTEAVTARPGGPVSTKALCVACHRFD